MSWIYLHFVLHTLLASFLSALTLEICFGSVLSSRLSQSYRNRRRWPSVKDTPRLESAPKLHQDPCLHQDLVIIPNWQKIFTTWIKLLVPMYYEFWNSIPWIHFLKDYLVIVLKHTIPIIDISFLNSSLLPCFPYL